MSLLAKEGLRLRRLKARMAEVYEVRPNLFIGNAEAALSRSTLELYEITALLSVLPDISLG